MGDDLPGQEVSNILLGKSGEIAPERMKRLSQSRNDTQLWICLVASLVAQTVKSLPVIWEAWVQSLGQEDPLEKEMATHSSTFAWKIPWVEEAD